MHTEGTRDEVCDQFEAYARKSPALIHKIRMIKATDVIGCFCKPRHCHVDTIIKLWKEMHEKCGLRLEARKRCALAHDHTGACES